MSEPVYPFDAWVLLPSFKPVKRTFTRGFASGAYTEEGKWYVTAAIHSSRSDALTDGHNLLNQQQARIDKQLAVMAKRRAALVKAEAP